MASQLTIERLWKEAGFTPNENQRKAILHTNGPLFLTAGPGSGKTRVLLWRTVNLIVFHGVNPNKIFFSTFTTKAALQLKELFNRFTEESLDPAKCKTENETLQKLLVMYQAYLDMLSANSMQKQVDFSMLQKAAYEQIEVFPDASSVYEHIIIDEYQDTNTIQEKIFFALAKEHKNLCVVGNDDHALYRFRGATVENLVEFEKRCQKAIGATLLRVDLNINYRSRKKMVDAYKSFINMTRIYRHIPKMQVFLLLSQHRTRTKNR